MRNLGDRQVRRPRAQSARVEFKGARLKRANVGGRAAGEGPQNQAARVDGISLRIFKKYREAPALAETGPRSHSRRYGEIKRRRA